MPRVAIETEARLDVDKGCTRCALREGARNVCIGADGVPGGLLVVGEAPSRDDDALGRPFVGVSGRYLRAQVDRVWSGPVVYDTAVRCAGTARDLKKIEKGVEPCRPFLAQTVSEAAPQRIIALGSLAALSVLGRVVSPLTCRKAYAFTGDGVPVFVLFSPLLGMRNRFLRGRFEEDIEWACTVTPTPTPTNAVARLVETVEDAEKAIEELRATGDRFGVDAETAGQMFDPSFRIITFAVAAWGSRDAYVWSRAACASPAVRAPLLAFLRDKEVTKGGANVKYDMVAVLAAWGAMPRNVSWDCRLARKVLDSDANAKLAVMAESVGMGGHKAEMEAAIAAGKDPIRKELARERREEKKHLAGKGPPAVPAQLRPLGVDVELEKLVRDDSVEDEKWQYAVTSDEVLYRYVARDAVSSVALGEKFEAELEAEPALARVWSKIVARTPVALAQIEAWGIQVDTRALRTFDSYLGAKEEAARRALAGYSDINWRSRDQIADLLFTQYKLPVVKLTDTEQASTDADALEQLRDLHPVVPHLIGFREVTKLRGTYGLGMLRHVRADGRIHPSILSDGARTGRTSSQDPNMQNIPSPKRRPTEGRMARDVFVARPGWKLVQLDYSQVELRVAAMLSRDPDMIAIFQAGVDFHLKTAQMISQLAWKIPPEAVTDEHRALAKTVNFGLLYGKKAHTLAREWGCAVSVADRIVEAILGKFKGLNKWLRDRLHETQRTGFSWTEWEGLPARRRDMYRVASPDDGQRATAENGAGNTPIQGTASDFLMASIVDSVEWLRADVVPAMLILPVHDSLLFEVRRDAVEEVIGVAREIMTSHDSRGVPLLVDVEVGDCWGSISKVKAVAA